MRRAALTLLGLTVLAGTAVRPGEGASSFTARDATASTRQTSWSPDGRWIAYVNEADRYRISLTAPDGSAELGFQNNVLDPVKWSPDGRRLAWMGFHQVTVVDVGSGAIKEWEAEPFSLAWSPDGERLVYQNRWSFLTVSLWDGSDRRELASGASNPEWSPDGQEISFFYTSRFFIQAIRPDGSARRTIIEAHTGASPRWDPAGERIAYRGADESGGGDRTVNLVGKDGSRRRSLGDPQSGRIAWSPSGRWLSVGGDLLEVDGTGRAHFDTWEVPRWSPRGDEVVYSRANVVFVGSTSGFERRIAVGSGPDWSPDGRRISFLRAPYDRPMSFDHCFARVFVVGADGTGERPVSTCRLVGGSRRDVITGTAGPDAAFGLGGPDLIGGGAGADRIDGGAGDDRLYGGPGEDIVTGDRGNDRLGVRDGMRDVVSCGRGRDIVYADALDAVAGDCEVVRRR